MLKVEEKYCNSYFNNVPIVKKANLIDSLLLAGILFFTILVPSIKINSNFYIGIEKGMNMLCTVIR